MRSLATSIVKSSLAVMVPPDITRAGLRAIMARKCCTSYFNEIKAKSNQSIEQADEESSFVVVMEELLLTLQPCFSISADKAKKAPPMNKSASFQEIQSIFAALQIEEAVGKAEESSISVSAMASELSFIELEPLKGEKDLAEEKLFAIYCLFDDLSQLRSYIVDLWTEFKHGKVDLITAAVTTNTAIQLAMQVQDELLEAYPETTDYQNILNTLLTCLVGPGHEQEEEIEIDDSIADWIFMPTNNILDDFCDILKPGQVPYLNRDQIGRYNPLRDRSQLSQAEKQQEDTTLLIGILPEFCFISKHQVALLATDQLTRGLCQMVVTKVIPVWLMFAATIFLDVHHSLREGYLQTFEQLMRKCEAAKATLERHFVLSEGLVKPAIWPRQNERTLHRFLDEIGHLLVDDPILPLKASQARRLGQPAPSSIETYYLLKRSPILCGVMAFAIDLEMQKLGVLLVNTMGTVAFGAHFYNALQQKPRPVIPWPMMDRVIALHGEEALFIGTKPTDIGESFRQICLFLDYSPETSAHNRRQVVPVSSNNSIKGLKETFLLGDIFYQALRGDGSMSLKMQNVEELLRNQAHDSQLASTGTDKHLCQKWANSHHLTPLEFVEALRTSFPTEQVKSKFNYFTMHEQSISLFRNLRQELDGEYSGFFNGMYIENEFQLPFLGPYAIMVAWGRRKTGESAGLTEAGIKMLDKIGNVYDSWVQEHKS
jgi:hypothetical protein